MLGSRARKHADLSRAAWVKRRAPLAAAQHKLEAVEELLLLLLRTVLGEHRPLLRGHAGATSASAEPAGWVGGSQPTQDIGGCSEHAIQAGPSPLPLLRR